MKRITIGCLLGVLSAGAWASQCDAPPYGASRGEYLAFQKDFAQYGGSKWLRMACGMKYEGMYRSLADKLTIGHGLIEKDSVAQLALETMQRALRGAGSLEQGGPEGLQQGLTQ